jgi:hypothetical protein
MTILFRNFFWNFPALPPRDTLRQRYWNFSAEAPAAISE